MDSVVIDWIHTSSLLFRTKAKAVSQRAPERQFVSYYDALTLFSGCNCADNTKDDAKHCPDSQVSVAAGHHHGNQTEEDIEASADIAALSTVTGADGNNTCHEEANSQQYTGRTAYFPIALECIAKTSRAGLQCNQDTQYNADDTNNKFGRFHDIFLLRNAR